MKTDSPPATPSKTPTDRKLTRALNQLLKALLGEDEQVRDSAITGLRRVGHPWVVDKVVGRLLRDLRSRDARKCKKAAVVLNLLGPAAFHLPT